MLYCPLDYYNHVQLSTCINSTSKSFIQYTIYNILYIYTYVTYNIIHIYICYIQCFPTWAPNVNTSNEDI